MTSTSNPPIALTLSLIVLCVVLFALSIYWLLFRKGQPLMPRPARPPTVATPPDPHAFEDEWEASAPYPEYAMHVAQQAHVSDRARHAAFAATNTPYEDDWNAFSTSHSITPPWRSAIDDASDSSYTHEDANQTEGATAHPTPSAASPSESPVTAPIAQIRCPRCLSSRVDTRNLARKAGSTIGSVAGATGALTAALAGAETGAAVGSVAGPLGTVFGGLAGAVIAGLAGSAAGCAAGSVVGAAIDANVLDNYRCLGCQHVFSVVQD